MEKKCVICNKVFISRNSANRKFCSSKCHLENLHKNINKGAKRKLVKDRECSICKKYFQVKYVSDKKKYCSVKCVGIANGNRCRITSYPTSLCTKCGKTFEVKRKESSGKYCSRSCSDATNKNKPIEWFIKNCEVCDKEYKFKSRSTKSKRKTCSRKCSHELKKIYGKEHPLYKSIEMKCKLCGKIKAVKPSKVGEFRFCSRRCVGVYMSLNQPRISSIELLLKEQFDKANLTYEQQFLFDFYIPDFAFVAQKLIVECDGDYWHNLPEQKVKDKQKDKYYNNKGWRVIRFWEHEIRKNPKKCLDKVLKLL